MSALRRTDGTAVGSTGEKNTWIAARLGITLYVFSNDRGDRKLPLQFLFRIQLYSE